MPYKISGTNSEACKTIVLPSDFSEVLSTQNNASGSYEHGGLVAGNKVVLGMKSDGETFGYSGVNPTYYQESYTQTFYPTQSSDDGYVRDDFDSINSTGNYFTIGVSSLGVGSGFWLRFPNIIIPKGATIVTSWIRLFGYGNSGFERSYILYGGDYDNFVSPTTYAGYYSLTLTSANVGWTCPPISPGIQVNISSLNAILQEIVNRPGWVSGNAVGFRSSNANAYPKSFYSFDSGVNKPQLYVSWLE